MPGCLSEEERNLAEELKSQCHPNGKEKNPQESAKTLHQLGLLYRNKSPDKVCLIQSVALLTSATIRKPDNSRKIQLDLKEVCGHILDLADASGNHESLQQFVSDLKNRVENFRSQTKKKLEAFHKIPDDVPENKLPPMHMRKIKDVKEIQLYLTDSYMQLMQSICRYCCSTLGDPPCKFALAAMGSLAKQEVTPYSDFESLILLEDEVKDSENFEDYLNYFRWFAMVFQMILVLLGETVLRFLTIPCLNNPDEPENDWFYDAHTPCGIRPDGFAPHACKNPLGRQTPTSKKKWTLELIKPVSEMGAYLEHSEDLKNGYHLADMLVSTCFVFGDQSVFNSFSVYIRKRKKKLHCENSEQNRVYLQQIQDDLRKFDFLRNIDSYFELEKIDLKRMFYRSATLFISSLGQLYETESLSCFGILDELKKKGIMSTQDFFRLSFAVAIACEFRLRCYVQFATQGDMVLQPFVLFLPCAIDGVTEAVGAKAFTQALAIAAAFQRSLEKFVASTGKMCEKFDFLPEKTLLYLKICLNLTLFKKAVELCRPLIQSQFALSFLDKQHLFKVYVTALQNCRRCKEACRIIKLNLANIRKSKLVHILNYAYASLCRCLLVIGDPKTALKYCKKANCLSFFGVVIPASPIPHGYWVSCYMHLGKFAKALKHLNKELAEYDKEKDKLHSGHFCMAMLSKGICLLNLDRIQEAKDIFENIIRMRRRSFLYDDNDHWTNLCKFQLSICKMKLGEPEQALNLFENMSDKDIVWKEDVVDQTKTLLRCKGHCLLQSKKTSEAYECYKELLQHYEVGCKTESNLGLAQCLGKLGVCAYILGKLDEAVGYYRKQLIVLENLKPRAHEKIAKAKSIVALLLSKLNKYDEAIPYFADKAVSKVKLGDSLSFDRDVEHAECHMFCGNVTEAIRLYRNAFEILEKLPKSGNKRLCNARDYSSDIARTGMLTCLSKLQLYDSEAMHHAREAWRESVELGCETRFTKRKVHALRNYGYCLSRLERYPECVQALKHALYLAQEAYEQPHLDEDFFCAAKTLISVPTFQGKERETRFYYYSPSVYYRCTCCDTFTDIPEAKCSCDNNVSEST